MAINRSIAAVMFGVVAMANAAPVDLAPVDKYLETWDRFARGDNTLVKRLDADWPKASAALVKALEAKDRRAPSRVAFLTFVQVMGFIPAESELGRAWRGYAGDKFPVSDLSGKKQYAAWDFYAWWKKNQSPSEDLPLLRQWMSREFARNVAIPQYERLLRTESK
jgi:hypothetical protein